METILAVDFGEKHIGVSIAYSPIAEPLTTIHYQETKKAVDFLIKILIQKKVNILLFGISEGQMAEKTYSFAEAIKKKWKGKVMFVDETLSSKSAEEQMIKLGRSRKYRKNREHEFAASLILQSFLDEYSN